MGNPRSGLLSNRCDPLSNRSSMERPVRTAGTPIPGTSNHFHIGKLQASSFENHLDRRCFGPSHRYTVETSNRELASPTPLRSDSKHLMDFRHHRRSQRGHAQPCEPAIQRDGKARCDASKCPRCTLESAPLCSWLRKDLRTDHLVPFRRQHRLRGYKPRVAPGNFSRSTNSDQRGTLGLRIPTEKLRSQLSACVTRFDARW